ncbi:hypothetical protein [Kocuria rosea]|uniref:hypothetical protein n=1 Tax=Kocuria rosea TaxID=1275 RepID=UPI00203C3CD7|nr:hypothetical protein [Kocuria rosea]MCM3687085.1 hypothetical protein [Kocuria rosea]
MSSRWICGTARARPGDRVEAWDGRRVRHVGTVAEVAPHLRVLWIVESGTGTKKLIPLDDYRLRRLPEARPA